MSEGEKIYDTASEWAKSYYTPIVQGISYKCKAPVVGTEPCTRAPIDLSDPRQSSSLIEHLKSKKHRLYYRDYQARVAATPHPEQQRITQYTGEPHISKYVDLMRYLVEYNVPLSFMRDPRFKTLLLGNYPFVEPSTVREKIINVGKHVKDQSLGSIGLSRNTLCFDLGTTNSLHTLAATAVSISSSNVERKTLSLSKMTVDETDAETMQGLIERCVKSIVEKGGLVVLLVTDNAPNLVRAASALKDQVAHIRCFVHTVQLWIKDHVMETDIVRKAIEEAEPRWTAPNLTRWWSTLRSLRETIPSSFSIGHGVIYLAPYEAYGRLLEKDETSLTQGMQILFTMGMLHGGSHLNSFRARMMWAVSPIMVVAAVLSADFDWSHLSESATRHVSNAFLEVIVPLTAMLRETNATADKITEERVRYATGSDRNFVPGNGSFWNWEPAKRTYPILSKVHDTIERTCCSEASCERYFSQQGYSHTPRRARMADDLVYAETDILFAPKENHKRLRESMIVIGDNGEESAPETQDTSQQVPPPHKTLQGDAALFFVDAFCRQQDFRAMHEGTVIAKRDGARYVITSKGDQRTKVNYTLSVVREGAKRSSPPIDVSEGETAWEISN